MIQGREVGVPRPFPFGDGDGRHDVARRVRKHWNDQRIRTSFQVGCHLGSPKAVVSVLVVSGAPARQPHALKTRKVDMSAIRGNIHVQGILWHRLSAADTLLAAMRQDKKQPLRRRSEGNPNSCAERDPAAWLSRHMGQSSGTLGHQTQEWQ